MACWTCQPFCDRCRPKFYVCPKCGGKGNVYFGKCLDCGQAMTDEDVEDARRRWAEKGDADASAPGGGQRAAVC